MWVDEPDVITRCIERHPGGDGHARRLCPGDEPLRLGRAVLARTIERSCV